MNEEIKFERDEVFNPEDYLYFYRSTLTSERLKEEIDFLVQFLSLSKPMKILDLACGHGRHANKLASLGHHLTGIDITKGFLDLAEKEAKEREVEVTYLQEDMRSISYKESFDRVYAMFTSLGYFAELENENVFRNIFNALAPNGIFCFDSHNRDSFLTYHLPFIVKEREGNFMIDHNQFETLSGRNHTKRTIFRDGHKKSFEFSVRFFNPTEISCLFYKIGFSTCDFYGGWDGTRLQADSKRMIVVAKK